MSVVVPTGADQAHREESPALPKVRVTMRGGKEGGLRLEGLTSHELQILEGSLERGAHWVRCVDGRLEYSPYYAPLPDPTEDEALMPFWRRSMDCEVQLSLFPMEPIPDWCSPSITISSLCGYNYSDENYALQAKNLTRWGFICMRSQRGASGHFLEQWYLPGLWAAKGELEQVIMALDPYLFDRGSSNEWLDDIFGRKKKPAPPANDKEKVARSLETAISFLCRKAQFGSIDATIQRAAAAIDD